MRKSIWIAREPGTDKIFIFSDEPIIVDDVWQGTLITVTHASMIPFEMAYGEKVRMDVADSCVMCGDVINESEEKTKKEPTFSNVCYLDFRYEIYVAILEEPNWNGRRYDYFDGDETEFKNDWPELIREENKEELHLLIDVMNGHIVNWPNGKSAEFSTVKITDTGEYYLLDANKKEIKGGESYVPKCLQINDNGYDDYLEFFVNEDGFIENWQWTEELLNDVIKNLR